MGRLAPGPRRNQHFPFRKLPYLPPCWQQAFRLNSAPAPGRVAQQTDLPRLTGNDAVIAPQRQLGYPAGIIGRLERVAHPQQ